MAQVEARKVLLKDLDGRYIVPWTGAVETVNGTKPDQSGNVEIEATAGADTTELCQQLIGFRNGYTGESLDYRDYLDRPTQDYLDSFYAFGSAYEGVINGTNA